MSNKLYIDKSVISESSRNLGYRHGYDLSKWLDDNGYGSGGTTVGNGIYGGSGSLIDNTVVDSSTNDIAFDFSSGGSFGINLQGGDGGAAFNILTDISLVAIGNDVMWMYGIEHPIDIAYWDGPLGGGGSRVSYVNINNVGVNIQSDENTLISSNVNTTLTGQASQVYGVNTADIYSGDILIQYAGTFITGSEAALGSYNAISSKTSLVRSHTGGIQIQSSFDDSLINITAGGLNGVVGLASTGVIALTPATDLGLYPAGNLKIKDGANTYNGASGTFTAQSGETITVRKGIITAITP